MSMKHKRKIIFGMIVIMIGIAAYFMMAHSAEHYTAFLTFLASIAGGFFLGNGLEHIGRRNGQ